MRQLNDDEILEVNDSNMLSEDDIIEESDPASLLSRLQSSLTPSPEMMDTAQGIQDSALDFSKGVARGITLEGLDELGGMIGAGVERGLGALGVGPAAVDAQLRAQGFTGSGVDQGIIGSYRDYQSGIAKDLKESEERSPYLTMAGQLAGNYAVGTAAAGALSSGTAKGAKSILDIAKDSGKSKAALELLKRGGQSYKEIAPLLALETGLASEKTLVGPGSDIGEFATDVASGMAYGLPAMIAGQGITDVVMPAGAAGLRKTGDVLREALDESPIGRQTEIAFKKYGQQYKVNPTSEKFVKYGDMKVEGGVPSSEWNINRAQEVVGRIKKADSKLIDSMEESLAAATKVGKTINAQDLADQAFQEIQTLATELPTILKDSNFNAMMSKALGRGYKDLTPKQIKASIKDITNSIEKIQGMKLPSPELQEAEKILRGLRNNLDERLKQTIPEYATAARRFYDFRRAYMEQPISGAMSPEVNDILYSTLNKAEPKLIGAYEDLIARSTADSHATADVETNFSKLMGALTDFEQKELSLLSQGKIKEPVMPGAKQFMQQISDYSDDAAVRRQTRKTQESQGGEKAFAKNLLGLGETGRGMALSAGYYTGRITASKPAQKVARMSRNIYNAPAETLASLGESLKANKKTRSLGVALLEGIQNGDAQKRNAALFTIMQNPNARAIVEEQDVEE